MKGKRNPALSVVLVGVLALAATAFAAPQGPHGGHGRFGHGEGPGGGHFGDMLAERLQLTDEQRQAAEALRSELEATVQPLFEQVHSLEGEIRDELAEASPDPLAVGERTIAVHRLREQIRAAHDEHLEAFRALLTDEQRAQLESMHRRGPHGRERWGEERGF